MQKHTEQEHSEDDYICTQVLVCCPVTEWRSSQPLLGLILCQEALDGGQYKLNLSLHQCRYFYLKEQFLLIHYYQDIYPKNMQQKLDLQLTISITLKHNHINLYLKLSFPLLRSFPTEILKSLFQSGLFLPSHGWSGISVKFHYHYSYEVKSVGVAPERQLLTTFPQMLVL